MALSTSSSRVWTGRSCPTLWDDPEQEGEAGGGSWRRQLAFIASALEAVSWEFPVPPEGGAVGQEPE